MHVVASSISGYASLLEMLVRIGLLCVLAVVIVHVCMYVCEQISKICKKISFKKIGNISIEKFFLQVHLKKNLL